MVMWRREGKWSPSLGTKTCHPCKLLGLRFRRALSFLQCLKFTLFFGEAGLLKQIELVARLPLGFEEVGLCRAEFVAWSKFYLFDHYDLGNSCLGQGQHFSDALEILKIDYVLISHCQIPDDDWMM